MKIRNMIYGAVAMSMAFTAPSFSQDSDEDDIDIEEVIVTGTRVRQGGAQDIKHFRSIAFSFDIPHADDLTVEGLLGEHDLHIEPQIKCRQLLCLSVDSMSANLPTQPEDMLFVGLGFASNLEGQDWSREPLNLVAVVDKSGSMEGDPLRLVRNSLRQIVGQLRDGDQISIVLYGDRSHVHLPPTPVKGQTKIIVDAIKAIESAGSTNMEEGLQVGYQTARMSAAEFDGNTRVMLFTDEQPNVGRTDADSFIGMATSASVDGIGLTTIGVGFQFDGSLASKVSSSRGGNLFFIQNDDEIMNVFSENLDTMVSELAHDLTITLAPMKGYRVSSVYGVPGEILSTGKDGTITITVPTVFLSTKGGGIYVTLAKDSESTFLPAAPLSDNVPLLQTTLSYIGAKDGIKATDEVAVMSPQARPAGALVRAHALVDEYLVIRDATNAYHQDSEPKKTYSLLSGLSDRLKLIKDESFDGERKLVSELLGKAAFYAGYGGELPKEAKPLAVIGMWEVEGLRGIADLSIGDRIQFTSDMGIEFYRKADDIDFMDEWEAFEINDKEIYFVGSDIIFRYRANGDKMTLSYRKRTNTRIAAQIRLRRL